MTGLDELIDYSIASRVEFLVKQFKTLVTGNQTARVPALAYA